MNAPATHGICTNLPSACSHAATRTPVPMSTPETRCPECQARLLPAAATTPAAATRGLAPWVIATALALLAAALLVGWLLMRPGNRRRKDSSSAGASAAPTVLEPCTRSSLPAPRRCGCTAPTRSAPRWHRRCWSPSCASRATPRSRPSPAPGSKSA